jgi:ABC-type multidrug transport system ATPase subunit
LTCSENLFSAGAGKSTLLDVLAMRLTGGTVSGRISVNGRKTSKARFRSISTYVPQVRSPAAALQLFNP